MRRIANRRPRLISLYDGGITHRQDLGSWHVELRAAALLRRLFPAFWAEQVAGRRLTAESLTQAGVALIRCVGEELTLSDWFIDRAGEVLGDLPALAFQQIDWQTDDSDVTELISEVVHAPPFAVYGVELDDEDGYTNLGPLGVAYWWLTMLESFDVSEVAEILGETHASLCDTLLYDVPRVDCRGQDEGQGTPLRRLCAALNADEAGTRWQGRGLGDLLAYALSTTDNPFADVGPFELYDAYGYGGGNTFDWDDAPLDELRRQQGEAYALANAFWGFERRFDWRTLIDVAEQIARVAASIGLPVHWPGADDEEEVTSDDTSTIDDAEAAALAAAPGAARAA